MVDPVSTSETCLAVCLEDVIWRNASLHLQTQASSKALLDGGSLTVSTVILEWKELGNLGNFKKTAHMGMCVSMFLMFTSICFMRIS